MRPQLQIRLSREELAREIMLAAIRKVEQLGFTMKVCGSPNQHGGWARNLALMGDRIIFYGPGK